MCNPRQNRNWLYLTVIAICCVFCFSACSVFCSHEWQDATCTAPKTCTKCGKTEGDVVPHEWQDATCTEPKICKNCGATEGEALGHSWEDATCSAPKTCSRCKKTEGNPLPHTLGDWETIEDGANPYVTSLMTIGQKCQVCGELVNVDFKSVSMRDGNVFVFSPNEFCERLGKLSKYVGSGTLSTKMACLDDGSMGCGVMKEGEAIAIINMNDEKKEMDKSQQDERNSISSLMVYYTIDDIETIVESMLGIITTCDETLEVSDAADVAQNLVIYSYANQIYEKNGIKYLLGQIDGRKGYYYLLVVSLVDSLPN